MNLRDWIYKNKMTVSSLARYLGVHRSYIHKWLRGDKVPSAEIMQTLAKISGNRIHSHEQLLDIRKKEVF